MICRYILKGVHRYITWCAPLLCVKVYREWVGAWSWICIPALASRCYRLIVCSHLYFNIRLSWITHRSVQPAMRTATTLVLDIYEIFMQQIGDMGYHNTLTAGSPWNSWQGDGYSPKFTKFSYLQTTKLFVKITFGSLLSLLSLLHISVCIHT